MAGPLKESTSFVRQARLWKLTQPLNRDSPLIAQVVQRDAPTQLRIEAHPGFEVGLVVSGKHERHSSDGAVTLVAGQVWLTGMWEAHGWRTPRGGTREIVLFFLPEFLGAERLERMSWLSVFAPPPSQRPQADTAELRQKVLAIAQDMHREIERRPPAWRSVVRLDLLRLFLELTRRWRPPRLAGHHFEVSAMNLARLLPAVELVHARSSSRVSVAEAAAACALSSSHFSRLFRATMGVSFGQFELRSRLGMAAHQLVSSDRSEEAIAKEADFADASHLSRMFVKHYGCAPGHYRHQDREGR